MQQEKFKKLYQMAVDDLTGNLLPWWMQYSVDEENGGFYGEVDNDNTPRRQTTTFPRPGTASSLRSTRA